MHKAVCVESIRHKVRATPVVCVVMLNWYWPRGARAKLKLACAAVMPLQPKR